MGRWRNGVPLSLSHWTPGHPGRERFRGPGLPPPMDQTVPQRLRLHRRGRGPRRLRRHVLPARCPHPSHQPPRQPDRAAQRQLHPPDRAPGHAVRAAVRPGQPRRRPRAEGCSGSFMCASLIAQYEAIMYDWANLGLQDPRVTGTNDPIIGANRPETSRFEIPIEGADPIVLTGFPRFTRPPARSTCSAPRSAPCASSPTCRRRAPD